MKRVARAEPAPGLYLAVVTYSVQPSFSATYASGVYPVRMRLMHHVNRAKRSPKRRHAVRPVYLYI